MHKSRANRNARARRCEAAHQRQQPLPLAEQRRRAAERAEMHAARYPHPPVYVTHVGTFTGEKDGRVRLKPIAKPRTMTISRATIGGLIRLITG